MQVSVTFDPTQDEGDVVVEQVLAAYGQTLEEFLDLYAVTADDEAGETPLPDRWTRRKMLNYMRVMKPTAQRAVLAIAQHPNGITTVEVMDLLNVERGPQFAGAMASAGFARNNTRGVSELPFQRTGNRYTMHTGVAELIVDVSAELGISV